MSVYAVDDFVDEHNTGQMDRVNMSLRSADVCIDPTTRPFPCGQAVPYDRFFVRFVVQGVYCHDFLLLPNTLYHLLLLHVTSYYLPVTSCYFLLLLVSPALV